jgi:hypothetical protein
VLKAISLVGEKESQMGTHTGATTSYLRHCAVTWMGQMGIRHETIRTFEGPDVQHQVKETARCLFEEHGPALYSRVLRLPPERLGALIACHPGDLGRSTHGELSLSEVMSLTATDNLHLDGSGKRYLAYGALAVLLDEMATVIVAKKQKYVT